MTFWQFFLYYMLSTGLLSLIGFGCACLVLLVVILYYNHEDKIEYEKKKSEQAPKGNTWYEK